MKTLRILLPLLVLAILSSCDKNNEEEVNTGPYDIFGKVTYDNGVIADNSEVYLNNEFKTTTNSEGAFTISDVSEGTYKLKAVGPENNIGYSELEIDVDLNGGDLNLENLQLPVPVQISEPVEATTNSIKLEWSQCNADDFREYKIYMHHSSALDENSGTLLHIATNVSDTVLMVNAGDFWWGGETVTPNTTYFFRVFVMNAIGRLSGSNIVEVTTDLWENEDEFTNNYKLELQQSVAAQGDLRGIAWDGNYYWMLYFEELGGFYDNNIVTLVKYDMDLGQTIRTIVWDDSNYFVEGITWDGEFIWISFGNCVKSVNLETELFDKTYCIGENTVDLAWSNNELLFLDTWNKAAFVNPANGVIGQQFNTPFVDLGYSGEKGIAYRNGEIWIINNWHYEICILDNNGKHIGVAEVDFLIPGFISNYHKMPMCFVDEKLIIALDSQIRFYSIEPIE